MIENAQTKTTQTMEGIKGLPFEDALEEVRRETDRLLNNAPRVIRTSTSHLAQARGKMIRAVSLLTCAERKDGLIHPDAVKLAVAVEILHLATLVHDDIVDNADTRRGIETLHKKYGKKNAVICGDYLFCLALKTAASVEERNSYLDFNVPDYMTRICVGELRENINNQNLEISVMEYLRIISGKTAALFEASFLAGFMLSSGDQKEEGRYARLGRYIGMIFQLTDDCVDFESTAEAAKKPVRSDFAQGVVTLPLIVAMKNSDLREELKKKKSVSSQTLADLVGRYGGIGYTKELIRRYYQKSSAILEQLDLSEEKRTRLSKILEKSLNGISV